MKTPSSSPRRKRWLRHILALVVFILALVITPHWWLRLVPLPPALFQPPSPSIELVDRNAISLREISQQDAKFSRSASLANIPRTLIDATLAAEDKRFFAHHGCDWRAVLRAARD